MQSDANLVKAVLDGDKSAFAALVKRYERPVRATVLHVLNDYHLASDISQDTFVAAYEKLDRLRKADNFGPWLMGIARYHAIDAVRKKQTQNEKPLEIAMDSAAQNDGHLDVDKQKILSALMKLPESEKQVVLLRYFSSQNVKDIAEILGRSVGTVTKQLSRAHIRLRKILERSQL